MSMIRIRPGIRADIPVLLEIYNYEVLHGTATLDIHSRTMEQWEEWFNEHGKENHPLLVAEIEDDDAGPDAAQRIRIPAASPAMPRSHPTGPRKRTRLRWSCPCT